jgi:hypothetical protein
MGRSSGLTRAVYRLSQGVAALTGRVDEAERAVALTCLPGPARAVFRALPASYQHHHLRVYRRLWQAGCRDRDVLAAALLHDMGKVDGRQRVCLWQRALVVLLGRWPGLLAWLAAAPARGWRYGFYLHARHAALGAAQAAALGCTPRTVALIAAHQDGGLDDAGLAQLRSADDNA